MSIVSLKQANIFQGNTLVLNNVNLDGIRVNSFT
jgi:hypothetical protein